MSRLERVRMRFGVTAEQASLSDEGLIKVTVGIEQQADSRLDVAR